MCGTIIGEPAVHVCRTAKHPCDWCGESIAAGERYERYRYRDGDRAATCRLHAECQAACTRLIAEDRYFDCWTPGDFSRGCSCERGCCECPKADREGVQS